MRKRKTLEEQIERLTQQRAGSIFPKEFEAGWIYGMLYALGEEPDYQSRAEVLRFIHSYQPSLVSMENSDKQ